jgi:hypothetical protein
MISHEIKNEGMQSLKFIFKHKLLKNCTIMKGVQSYESKYRII